jgi:hypothetical protein
MAGVDTNGTIVANQPYGPLHYSFTKINIILGILAWTAYSLRLFVRFKYRTVWGLDATFLSVALVVYLYFQANDKFANTVTVGIVHRLARTKYSIYVDICQ